MDAPPGRIMTDTNNFQRRGAISNAHAGREFEEAARLFFENTGIPLSPAFPVPVGGRIKKSHNFDLGSENPPILVECKSYTWTETGKSPSAKLRGMNRVVFSAYHLTIENTVRPKAYISNATDPGNHSSPQDRAIPER
jgi:hypothetical protein